MIALYHMMLYMYSSTHTHRHTMRHALSQRGGVRMRVCIRAVCTRAYTYTRKVVQFDFTVFSSSYPSNGNCARAQQT